MGMMLEQFKIIFDRPEKVEKLRETILNLAVRGKLVEQNPNDEPASTLVKLMKTENEELLKKGLYNKQRKIVDKVDAEKEYGLLPKGWKWCSIDDVVPYITDFQANGSFASIKQNVKTYYDKNYAILVRLKDLRVDIRNNDLLYTDVSGYEYLSKSHLYGGELLVANVGAGIGTCLEMPVINQKAAIAPNMFIIYPSKYVNNQFFKYYTRSSLYMDELSMKAVSTGQPKMNKNEFRSLTYPLAPFEEQKRIVEKVDSLMTFCDKLEKALEKKVHYGSLSAKSVFNSIGNATTTKELEETLRFILSNFKDLSLGDNGVKELKNCILQLAVQGKLVWQDLSDEPAEVLLEKIHKEKERLIKEKKIKKEKPLAEISEEEKPWELPEGWKWVRLDEICIYVQRGKSPVYSEIREIPVIAQKCVQWNGFDINKAKFIDPETIGKYADERILEVGDLLWNSTGLGTLGRINIYPGINKYNKVVADSHVTVIRVVKEYVDYKYLFNWLSGPKVQGEIESKSSGSTKQMELSTSTVKSYVVPLPPLEEQRRIAEKVDSLMQLCNELESNIEKSKKNSERLMQSVLQDVFNDKNEENNQLSFGEFIKQKRKDKGITITNMLELLKDVKSSEYTKIEEGFVKPEQFIIDKIANALKLSEIEIKYLKKLKIKVDMEKYLDSDYEIKIAARRINKN